MTHSKLYRSFLRRSSQPISWMVQNTQPSQPITWLTKLLACWITAQTRTRSQAIARIANRTASQHILGSRDVIVSDHVIPHMPFPIGGPLEPSLYL